MSGRVLHLFLLVKTGFATFSLSQREIKVDENIGILLSDEDMYHWIRDEYLSKRGFLNHLSAYRYSHCDFYLVCPPTDLEQRADDDSARNGGREDIHLERCRFLHLMNQSTSSISMYTIPSSPSLLRNFITRSTVRRTYYPGRTAFFPFMGAAETQVPMLSNRCRSVGEGLMRTTSEGIGSMASMPERGWRCGLLEHTLLASSFHRLSLRLCGFLAFIRTSSPPSLR